MNENPGLEETKRDIEITRREIEAYKKLQQGYNEIAFLPDRSSKNRLEYAIKADHFRVLAISCGQFLDKLISEKETLEFLQDAEIIMPKYNKLEGTK